MFLWHVKTNMSHYNREQRLRETLNLHEFKRESAELEEWIGQQTQIAASKDFGSDYENALVRSSQITSPKICHCPAYLPSNYFALYFNWLGSNDFVMFN